MKRMAASYARAALAWYRAGLRRLNSTRKNFVREARARLDSVEAAAQRIAEDLRERAERVMQDREANLFADASFGLECVAALSSAPVRTYFARAEAGLIDRLVTLPLDDDDGRRRLAIAIQTTRQLAEFLLKSAQVGRVAEAEIEKLRAGRERKLRSVR